nr:formamidopyrimidine-DNA glycosylase-like [Nerophis lumbriciformis]
MAHNGAVPELPDLKLYQSAIEQRAAGQTLRKLRIASPFVLRTVAPAGTAFVDHPLQAVERIGKQLVLVFAEELFAVVHLMISGRFQWVAAGAGIPRGRGLAAWDFDHGTLLLTEASKKKRASIHLVERRDGLAGFDRGGLDPLTVGLDRFRDQLCGRNQTLKRALTDQRLLAGIGNAYSDEILWAARLSPYKNTTKLSDAEWAQLHGAMQSTLTQWSEWLLTQHRDQWPKKVTAFLPDMAVHGKYGEACPKCSAPVQRIMYAGKNDANYCAGCQTGGKILADRMLSRLLKDSWPKTLAELE